MTRGSKFIGRTRDNGGFQRTFTAGDRMARIREVMDALLRRFANPALPHRTQQIAMDGSQKLPQRLLATARDNLAADRSIPLLALAVAGWMRYVVGRDEASRPIKVDDPLAAQLAAIAGRHPDDPRALAHALLDIRAIFGDDLPRDPRFAEPVAAWLEKLFANGAARTVAEAVRTD